MIKVRDDTAAILDGLTLADRFDPEGVAESA